MSQVSGGVVRYMRRVKTGDYEHKEAAVELSFSVGDGEDSTKVFNDAGAAALTKVNQLLYEPRQAVASTPETPAATDAEPVKPKGKGRPPRQAGPQLDPTSPPPTSAPVDPAAIEDGIDVVTEQPKPAEPVAADPADLSDLLGEAPPAPITDKDLNSAITQRQAKINNGTAIRGLVIKFAGPPPKMSRDIPQEQRQVFLDELNKL